MKPVAAKYLQPYEDGGSHFLPERALLNPKNINDKNGQLPRRVLDRLKARKRAGKQHGSGQSGSPRADHG